MDRTGKIAVAIAFAVMIGWMVYQEKVNPPAPVPAAAPSATPAVAGATQQTGSTASSGAQTVNPAPAPEPPEPVLPEQTQEIDTPSVNFTFTNHGGGIARAQLNTHTVDQDSNGKKVVLNDYASVPIGAISEEPGEDATASCKTTGVDAQGGISYQRTTAGQIEITRKFTLPTAKEGLEQYIATLDLTITNRGEKPYKSGGYYVYLGSAAPIHDHDQSRYICLDWYHNGSATQVNALSAFNAGKIPLLGIQTSPEKTVYTATADIGWAGVYNQYFTTIVTPVGGGADRVWANRSPLDIPTHQSGPDWLRDHPNTTPTWYAINGAMGMPGFDLAPAGKPGDTYVKQFKIYLGPREYHLLSQMDGGQVAILHLGWFRVVSVFLLTVMNWLKPLVGGYAVAIIVMTIAIKSLLWPLQNRATQSMKKMQALTPKMNELREKYKEDPAKLNQETIRLYKTYGVNPVAGCLPMFIQLPIFYGFYTMLGSAIELRNSKFFWVHDLSQPDTVGHLPILGWAINVLPLLMAATSVWMMSMTPKSGDASQQKMMMFMPLIFLGICYNYASGLALYFMVSNLCTVAQYYLTKNQTAPTLEKVAVAGKKKR